MNTHKLTVDRSDGFNGHRIAAFLVAGVLSLVLVLAAYVGYASFKITNSDVPSTYKWFLLDKVPGPRLIIESGSNGHIGLNTDTISEALDITAINIADNAGYDIEQKAARLLAHTRPGDIVILPLEWSHYLRETLTDDFVDGLPALNRDYFHSVSLSDKVRLALALPPARVFGFKPPVQQASPNDLSPVQSLYVAALMRPSGHESFEVARPLAAGVAGQSCDEYLFGGEPLEVSTKFKRALRAFKRLDARGVKVVFAWPVMAGDDCFVAGSPLHDFADKVEELVRASGLEFIGRPSQSVYPTTLRDDTPYHVIRAGSDLHTARFIQLLGNHGIRPKGTRRDLSVFATTLLYELEHQNVSIGALRDFPTERSVTIADQESLDFVDFAAGWWSHESHGRWMRDHEAVFRIHLPMELDDTAHMKVGGIAYGGEGINAQIFVGGILSTSGLLGGDSSLQVPLVDAPRGQVVDFIIRLNEDGRPAQSPYQRGDGEDHRTLTFNLQRLSIESETSSQHTGSLLVSDQDIKAEPSELVSEVKPSKSLSNSLNQALSPNIMSFSINETVRIGSLSADQKISFGENWWSNEPGGRWMKCCEAELVLRLPEKLPETAILEISGDAFGEQGAILQVRLNGKVAINEFFSRASPIRIPLEGVLHDGYLQVELSFPEQSFQSPKALGYSDDDRTLSGFFESVTLLANSIASQTEP